MSVVNGVPTPPSLMEERLYIRNEIILPAELERVWHRKRAARFTIHVN